MYVLGVIKGLGYYKKCYLAVSVFDWIRETKDFESDLSCSIVAVIISMLGKEGKVSAAGSLLNNLRKVGFDIDVYVYELGLFNRKVGNVFT